MSEATGTSTQNRDDGSAGVLAWIDGPGNARNETVTLAEGVTYGFGLMIYLVGLVFVTGVLNLFAGLTFGLAGAFDSLLAAVIVALIGMFVGFVAMIVFTAGIAGLLYKIIADGVSRGRA